MEFKDFEQSLKRLEQIVSELEKGELALEKALELFWIWGGPGEY